MLSNRLRLSGELLSVVVVAGVVFWLGFDGGSHDLQGRASVAIAIWWTIIVVIGLGLARTPRLPVEAVVAGGCLAGLTVLALVSMVWASSPERAFAEFNRDSLYLGMFVLVVLTARSATLARWSDGIAVGITGIAIVALTSRVFPNTFSDGELAQLLPSAQTRLSYPLGYWNGLAILLALGVPLLLRAAVANENWLRGLAVAPVPIFAADIFLTSSRGGVAVALLGTVIFLSLTTSRWTSVGVALIALGGSVAAVAVLLSRNELVNGPLSSATAAAQGREAALLFIVVCLATGLLCVLAWKYLSRLVRPGPLAGHVLAASVVVAALAGIAASNPVRRFDAFKQPPNGLTQPQSDFVKAHLLSGNGNGRWQFWQAAVQEFDSRPAFGRGAGSYEAWWAQHGTISLFVRDAHSLYLETMGELGMVGLLLVAGIFISGLAAIPSRIGRLQGDERTTFAALAAAFVAYALALGIDWMWELTVVSLIGVTLLALVTSFATASLQASHLRAGHAGRSNRGRSRPRLVAGVITLVAAWLLLCCQTLPLLADMKIHDSQVAAGRGDGEAALSDAVTARNLQPWAASPYVQLALVQEQVGAIEAARVSMRKAIDRDGEDWRVWVIAARIEAKAGLIDAALASLERAADLNPRSPLFAGLRD